MKITINDPSGAEHELESILLEFAQLHSQAQAIIGAIDQRISIIEAMLGIEHGTLEQAQEESKDV